MAEENKSQKFAKKLLSILGENRWREVPLLVIIVIIPSLIILFLCFASKDFADSLLRFFGAN